MTHLTISIPDPNVRAFVDQVVASGTYPNADEYVLALIAEDRKRRNATLEKLLLEGLEGEPRELTNRDWDEMRRQFDERHHHVTNGL